jgi:hypothetical protein
VNLARVILLLSAAAFAGFGVWGLAAPAGMLGMVEVTAVTPTARTELRAFYGGLELGIAVFLVVCLARRDRVGIGLLASAITLTTVALARGTSAVLDGPVSPLIYYLLIAEVVGAVLSIAGWRLATQASH